MLQKYVAVTAHLVKEGTQLFVSLQSPVKPLSADTLGALTKKILQKYGVPPDFAPHSTRGAGVQFFKRQGLSSEEVCQIGQWRDVQSFASHYLRLNAAEKAGVTVGKMADSREKRPGRK